MGLKYLPQNKQNLKEEEKFEERDEQAAAGAANIEQEPNDKD